MKAEDDHGTSINGLYTTVVSRGLCVRLIINVRRDRLKASVLVNGGHFDS